MFARRPVPSSPARAVFASCVFRRVRAEEERAAASGFATRGFPRWLTCSSLWRMPRDGSKTSPRRRRVRSVACCAKSRDCTTRMGRGYDSSEKASPACSSANERSRQQDHCRPDRTARYTPERDSVAAAVHCANGACAGAGGVFSEADSRVADAAWGQSGHARTTTWRIRRAGSVVGAVRPAAVAAGAAIARRDRTESSSLATNDHAGSPSLHSASAQIRVGFRSRKPKRPTKAAPCHHIHT